MPLQLMFETIYAEQLWGSHAEHRFYSGDGTHNRDITASTVDYLRTLIRELPAAPVIVDLGCGDFHFGSQLSDLSRHYHACDIALNVIEHNKQTFASDRISFHHLDACLEQPPAGDLLIIRQVLQHLSNRQIGQILQWLQHYEYVVITEHLPAGTFKANTDKPAGADSRLRFHSGVQVDQPPFNIQSKTRQIIDSCQDSGTFGGIIQTTLYIQPRQPAFEK